LAIAAETLLDNSPTTNYKVIDMKNNQEDFEITLLAHLVSDAKAIEKSLTSGISEEHFVFVEGNYKNSMTKKIFTYIKDYYKASGGSLFTSFVLESKIVEEAIPDKGRGRLMTLWADIESIDADPNNLHEVIHQIKNRHCLRILKEMFADGLNELETTGVSGAVNIIQDKLEKINEQMNEFASDIHNIDVSESAEYFREEYTKRVQQPELFHGIPCGLENIDNRTFGFLPGQIIVFLAPSSGGKSVMLLNSAVHANTVAKKNVLYMSFEMNSWLCMLRHISLQYEIPYNQLKNVELTKQELNKLIEKMQAKKDGPYFEYDVNMEDPTPDYIDSRIRDLIATKGKPDLLVVDYIGNMTIRNAPQNAKDYELQSKAVQELFKMAKRYNIPIITAQQINRETIRDARKAKEANKFMSYDQAAVSGGQVLMHLCTYAIAMEPNKEQGYCIFHPVKMRDAYFTPFPVRMEPEFNKVRELTEEEQLQIMAMHAMSNGLPVSSTKDNVPPKKNVMPSVPVEELPTSIDEDEEIPQIDTSVEMELDLSSWSL
jgi:replicative DNA helicase